MLAIEYSWWCSVAQLFECQIPEGSETHISIFQNDVQLLPER